MEFLKPALVFGVIVLLLVCKRPLWQAILGGLAAAALFFDIDIFKLTGKVVTDRSSLSVLLSLYLITFLQRILESRSQIRLAQEDLNRLFHNRRVSFRLRMSALWSRRITTTLRSATLFAKPCPERSHSACS